ncbi:MAG: 1-deoxy-D-xylulose-5-phosphate reductoisomerase [Armatimonadetes bacterium]|nr:1-deoxy-D-xylulose-5-phosphate reductoisomerase [Armatimonadota bacterium]
MKNLALLGSTGSIGRQVLDVVSRLPDRLKVVSIAANRNVELLADQVRKFEPYVVSVGTEEHARQLSDLLGNTKPPAIYSGAKGLETVATHPEADIAVIAVAGAVGLAPTIAAILAGKHIALASKEVLVAAGSLVTKLAEEKGIQILPIDSEHSAIFQCLQGQDRSRLRKLILTASGGAFAKYPIEQLQTVSIQEALAHPTWSMGRKITIDSATLMNKGLEIIEARWLFGMDPSRIEVVIHPQSIVHSMVEFEDGSVLAQMGIPDMRLPIQYALLYPERIDTGLPRLDIAAQGLLTFERPDPARYPALELAYRAAEQGGTMPAVMNAANEVAVGLFLEGKIGFLEIERKVRRVMEKHKPIYDPDLAQILEADSWARITAAE